MTKEASLKIAVILQKVLDGYSLGKKYNYCLEYSVDGLIKDTQMNDSEVDLILQHLQEKEIIDDFVDSGDDEVIKESTFKIYFPDDFVVKAEQYISHLIGEEKSARVITKAELPTPDIVTGKLILYSDGTTRYDGELVEMRTQMRELCRLFMQNVDSLVGIDTIKDELVSADKRSSTPTNTISKYVSELRTILQHFYGKNVIFNQDKDGWIFSPERTFDS
jgi:hypothetical protein